MDTTRLIKLLNLTTSPEDGEALSAVRFANALLAKEGKTWEQVLNSSGPSIGDIFSHTWRPPANPYVNPALRDREKIMRMFDAVLYSVKSSAREFIESLHEQFLDRGSLSQKQYDALEKFYNNAQR